MQSRRSSSSTSTRVAPGKVVPTANVVGMTASQRQSSAPCSIRRTLQSLSAVDEALEAIERLEPYRPWRPERPYVDRFDGTQYFCSNKLSCQNCSTRKRANGAVEYFHTLVAAVVTPGTTGRCLGRSSCSRRTGATNRIAKSRRAPLAHRPCERVKRLNPVYLGDDLYSNQPLCEAVVAAAGIFCSSASRQHKTLNEYLTGLDLPSKSQEMRRGRQRAPMSGAG